MITEVKVSTQLHMLVDHRAALNVSCTFPGVFKNGAFKHCICMPECWGEETGYLPFSVTLWGPCLWQAEVLATREDPASSTVTKPRPRSTACVSRTNVHHLRHEMPLIYENVLPTSRPLKNNWLRKSKASEAALTEAILPRKQPQHGGKSQLQRAAWCLPSCFGLKRAWLHLRWFQVWVPLLGAWRTIPSDEACAAWEVKGLRKFKS